MGKLGMVIVQQRFRVSDGVASVGSVNDSGEGRAGSGMAGIGIHGTQAPHENVRLDSQVAQFVTAVLTATVAELDAAAAGGLGSTGGV